MIVYNFNVRRAGCILRPFKANPPLHVDADAELPGPVAFKAFKAVAGQSPQVLETCRGVQYFETLPGLPVETLKLPDKFAPRENLGSFVPVAQYHIIIIDDIDDLRQA